MADVISAATKAAATTGVVPPVHLDLAEEPSMAAEDFSFYGQAVPAVFSFLGIGDVALGTDASLHNPHFKWV